MWPFGSGYQPTSDPKTPPPNGGTGAKLPLGPYEHESPPRIPKEDKPMSDNWLDQSTFACATCRLYVPKGDKIGRCRRNAPVVGEGWPAVYPSDWCGEHKIDHKKLG